ncbi:hypothetical protein [Nocardia noduli]|uniref:hypothetical protein n=1 Tax=Nocardia noduli TaxID=2815722 RepID=UPI001C229A0D|nr:hypothetical protein [Nocardia noduli]
MTVEITAAHRELLDHLMEEEFITLTVLATGRYWHNSTLLDMPVDWISPVPAFTHPADPTRLLIGVFTAHGWTLVALDQLAHLLCEHPICVDVHERRRRELSEIPADASLFAIRHDVRTDWSAEPLPYVVHIDDHRGLQENGWNAVLDHPTEVARSTAIGVLQERRDEPDASGAENLMQAWLRERRGDLFSNIDGAAAAVSAAARMPGGAVLWSNTDPDQVTSVEPVAVCTDRWLSALPEYTEDSTAPYSVSKDHRGRIVHVAAANGTWSFLVDRDHPIDPALLLGSYLCGWVLRECADPTHVPGQEES